METERLILRRLKPLDYDDLCEILQDSEVVYAYEEPFSSEEVKEWLSKQFKRYEKYGFGLWAVILKENRELIEQCGLTMQPWKEEEVLEIFYLRKSTGIMGTQPKPLIFVKTMLFNI